jgi:hypothetical protein
VNELLQFSWVAILASTHNAKLLQVRDLSVHGEVDAREGAREGALAIGKIEGAIPLKERPIADLSVQFENRQKLIGDWWQEAGPTAWKVFTCPFAAGKPLAPAFERADREWVHLSQS